jgi:hypothetical protein
MSEKFKLIKNIENFIDAECAYKKNSPFTATFHKENGNSDLFPKIYDNSNFIQCLMNIPKEKEALLIGDKKEFKLNVTDSSFEFVLYKNNNYPSVIKCLLLLIVNDFEKAEGTEETKQDKEKPENEKAPSDINNEYKLLEKLKKFIFNYIKINKKNKNLQGNSNIIETILLGGAKNDIRFFNLENNGINIEDENIKKISEIIKSIASKLEIKQKKNEEKEKQEEKENEEAKQKNDINEVLDELNPDYKNELIFRYLDEMPEKLVDLMKKYRKINFTKSMYNDYLANKNKIVPMDTTMEKMNIEN